MPIARGCGRASSGSQSTVTIGQFFGTLKRQFVLVLICLLLGVALSAALLAKTPKSYQSTAVVDITPTLPTSSGSGSNNGVNTITEAKIATSSSVALSAAKKLGFAGTPTDLAQHVSVTSPLSSQVLNITFTSSSAQGAADGANAFAQSYLDYRTATAQADLQLRISRIDDQITALQQKAKTGSTSSQISQLLTQLNSYRTVVVTPGQVAGIAAVPPGPSSPKPALYLAAGLLVGLLVGAVLALVRDLRDDRVRGKADLEPSLGAPVIAEAVSAEVTAKAWPRTLVTLAAPRGHEADAYRTVATTVSADAAESQIVMLCSTGREGRSLAPMNLAATYALQGLRTVLAGPRAALEPVTGLLGIAELATAPTDRLAEQLIASDTVPGLFVLPLGDEVTIGATLRGNDDQLEERARRGRRDRAGRGQHRAAQHVAATGPAGRRGGRAGLRQPHHAPGSGTARPAPGAGPGQHLRRHPAQSPVLAAPPPAASGGHRHRAAAGPVRQRQRRIEAHRPRCGPANPVAVVSRRPTACGAATPNS